ILALEEPPPIRLDRFIPPLIRERLELLGIPGTRRLQHRPVLEIKEVADLAIGVGMRPAHEAVADDGDVEGFWHCWILTGRLLLDHSRNHACEAGAGIVNGCARTRFPGQAQWAPSFIRLSNTTSASKMSRLSARLRTGTSKFGRSTRASSLPSATTSCLTRWLSPAASTWAGEPTRTAPCPRP